MSSTINDNDYEKGLTNNKKRSINENDIENDNNINKKSKPEVTVDPSKNFNGIVKMEKSLFGVEPSDEFTNYIADWIWLNSKDCQYKVEVSNYSSNRYQ